MLERINNVNGNVSSILNNNDNDIDRAKVVETIAMKLVDKFKSQDSYKFYCLVAYKLPESKIWLNYEQATSGKNPAGLFNWLCRRDMNRA